MSTMLTKRQDSLSETKRRLLEGYRTGGVASKSGSTLKITLRPKGTVAPLSLAQEQILRRERNSADGCFPHNECITLKANKHFDATILESCFAEIVRRHEIWRTTYGHTDGQAVQIVHEASRSFPLQVVNLRTNSHTQQEKQLSELYNQEIRRPFDLQRGPLIRVMLVNLSDTDQLILLFAHLSVVDGVSVYQILPTELTILYEAFSMGKSSPLSELPIQYSDYAFWQRQGLRSPEIGKEIAYWREELAGELPILKWPVDRPPQAVQNHQGKVQSFALRDGLKQFSVDEGVTLFTMLAASLGALFYCYTGQNRIVLGTPSLGARKRSEVAGLLGHFLNPVPLHIDLRKELSCRELMLRLQQVVGRALAHDEVPVDVLDRELHPNSGPDGSALFHVALSLQPQSRTEWQVSSMDADSGGTIWGLYLAFIETKNGLVGRVQYSTEIFDEETIRRTLEGLEAVMECFMCDPSQSISALSSRLSNLELL